MPVDLRVGIPYVGTPDQGGGVETKSTPAKVVALCRLAKTTRNAYATAKCNAFLQQQGALAQRDLTLSHLLVYSLITLGVVVVLAAVLGWIVAGRALRPLHTITAAARAASEDNLSARVALRGPRDELRELADTFDDMLDRLQTAFEGQRRFIANASHQLRTPLTLLNTQVHYALATQDTEAKDEALRALRDCIRQSNRIANQLLTLSRAETGSGIPVKVNPVDLNEVARLALEKVAALAERRGIDLGFDARGHAVADRATVYGDEVLILEMIVNLVDNAVRYTPPGGQVTITVDHVDGGWRFAVADSGPGIPVHERKHVFERFYRIDGTDGEGSGLGLSIVQEIARACGAVVALGEAEGGHGLLVTVTFPRKFAPDARPE